MKKVPQIVVEIEPKELRPDQQEAWRRLWDRLLSTLPKEKEEGVEKGEND